MSLSDGPAAIGQCKGSVVLHALLALSLLSGCQASGGHRQYSTLPQSQHRDPVRAQQLNDEGLKAVEAGELNAAEEKFREALVKDLYSASAHNNLGLVLLQSDRHYEAAWEFDYAAKLVPESPEPRQNLALLYEHLGRIDLAIAEYETALEIDPNNLATMRYLARAYVKAGKNHEKVKTLFARLLEVPHDEQWDVWIRGQLVRLGRTDDESTPARTPF